MNILIKSNPPLANLNPLSKNHRSAPGLPVLECPHRQNYRKRQPYIKTKLPRVRETAYNTLVCPQLEFAAPRMGSPHSGKYTPDGENTTPSYKVDQSDD